MSARPATASAIVNVLILRTTRRPRAGRVVSHKVRGCPPIVGRLARRFPHPVKPIAPLLALLFGMSAPAALAAPPANDQSLDAIALNQPGTKMPRALVSSPVRDPPEAGARADLLSPPSVGGPPEPSE